MNNQRQANFEYLRIIAMAMVVTLHYFFKTCFCAPVCDNDTVQNILLWLFPSFAMCAVNVYVLISGYFLVEAQFKERRLLDLFIQLLEYTLIITVVLFATEQLSISDFHTYEFFELLLPIGTEGFWFVSSYVIMYLLSPVLAAGVRAISARQLKFVILGLLIFESVEKTILPINLPNDRHGYDFGWFIVLFLIAAYIRLYGIKVFEESKSMGWIAYVLSSLVIWAVQIGFGKCYIDTEMEVFRHYADISTDYNFLFCLIGAIGLFYGFKNMNMAEDSLWSRICRVIGPMTLGVYLLHEHFLMRYRWPILMKLDQKTTMGEILLWWFISLIIIYGAGLIVESVRLTLHKKIFRK